MTKVMYNGNLIELADELEEGFVELDMLNPLKKNNEDLEKAKKYADCYIFEYNDKNPKYIEKPSLT